MNFSWISQRNLGTGYVDVKTLAPYPLSAKKMLRDQKKLCKTSFGWKVPNDPKAPKDNIFREYLNKFMNFYIWVCKTNHFFSFSYFCSFGILSVSFDVIKVWRIFFPALRPFFRWRPRLMWILRNRHSPQFWRIFGPINPPSPLFSSNSSTVLCNLWIALNDKLNK